MIYPISEIFTSFQGEGWWSGTPMTFIRLAGCSVGKPYPKNPDGEKQKDGSTRWSILPIYTEECTLYDGRKFPCDTNYRATEKLPTEVILKRIPDNIHRVCITGGEPMMHDLSELIDSILEIKRKVHIETSGTIPYKKYLGYNGERVWVTVSPKYGVCGDMITRANELKFLVDENFDPEKFFDYLLTGIPGTTNPLALASQVAMYLHPVNFEHEIHADNLKRCIEWQTKYPDFRIGPQLHKAVSHFIKEIIR